MIHHHRIQKDRTALESGLEGELDFTWEGAGSQGQGWGISEPGPPFLSPTTPPLRGPGLPEPLTLLGTGCCFRPSCCCSPGVPFPPSSPHSLLLFYKTQVPVTLPKEFSLTETGWVQGLPPVLWQHSASVSIAALYTLHCNDLLSICFLHQIVSSGEGGAGNLAQSTSAHYWMKHTL